MSLLKSLLSPVTSQVLGKMPGSAHLLLPDVVTLGQSHAASPEMEEWVTGLLGKPQTEHRQAWSRRHSEVSARDVVAFPAETSAPVSTEEQTVCPSSGRGRQASSVARSPLDRYSQNPREHACGTRASRRLTWGAAAVRSPTQLACGSRLRELPACGRGAWNRGLWRAPSSRL